MALSCSWLKDKSSSVACMSYASTSFRRETARPEQLEAVAGVLSGPGSGKGGAI